MLRTLSLLGVLSLLLLGSSFSKAAVPSVQATCLPGMQGMNTQEENTGLQHYRYVGVNSDTDITQLYLQGKAVIWYRKGDDTEFFGRNTWMKPQQKNAWDISPDWAIFHPDWRIDAVRDAGGHCPHDSAAENRD